MTDRPAYALERVTEPGAEPLSLAEAKLYLRVDGSSEDALITDMIAAVREAAELYLCRSLITQQWQLTFEGYVATQVTLLNGPVQSVNSVKARDSNGLETAVGANMYHLGAGNRALHFHSAVLGHEVIIAYTTGYGDATEVPESIRQGLLLHLAALYDNRLQGMEMPMAAKTLYSPYRAMRLS